MKINIEQRFKLTLPHLFTYPLWIKQRQKFPCNKTKSTHTNSIKQSHKDKITQSTY